MENERCYIKILPLAGLAALLAGCASNGGYSAMTPPRPLGTAYAPVDAAAEVTVTATNAAIPDVLQLPDALALALRGNPDLAAFSCEVRAAEARVLQAGLLPNPELELAVDEYDRDGAGFDSAETSVTLGQLFELGGKRRWRKRMAEAEGELAGWDYESKRLDVFAETAQRFTAVQAAQERLALARSGVELATQVDRAVSLRVEAGKEPPLQASKSAAELEMARLEADEAGNALGNARRKLAAMWGAPQAGFENVQGDLKSVMKDVPALEVLQSHLVNNPELARWEPELCLRRAALSAEKAARIPDLQGSVGYLQYEEDDTDALAFGAGLPLPLFDRNQGNIAAARHSLAKAEAERSATEVALEADLAEAHALLRMALQRVVALREKVVPAMEEAFRAAHEGYQQGKFGFLDMLDAQRGLFDAKIALLEAQGGYQSALIDIQRLTGTDIETLMNKKMEE